MAVVVTGLNALKLLTQFGVDQSKLDWLMDNGVEIKILATEIKFSHQGHAISVPIKLEQLQALKAGNLPMLTKTATKVVLTGAIKKLQDQAGSPKTPFKHPLMEAQEQSELEEIKPTGILNMLKSKQEAQAATEKETQEDWLATGAGVPVKFFPGTSALTVDSAKLQTATPVKLRQATMMYQPVHGSSQKSRYFLVGASKTLRIAARYKGTSLSIRVEGEGYAALKDKIELCGFTSLYPEYASLHLQVETPVLAAKALGAILLGLGVPLMTPMPNVNMIRDLGT